MRPVVSCAVPPQTARWRNLSLFWALVTFVTSCTVVKPKAFVHGVGKVASGAITERGFSSFWSSWWWVFVKGYHVMEYAILTALLCFWLDKRPVWMPMLVAIAYATSDEIHQLWVPARGGHVTDVMIDGIGVVFAGCLMAW